MNPFLAYMLKVAAGLAVFYAGYWLFLKKETYFQLNRFYLVSTLILAFILPAFPVTSPFRLTSAASLTDPLSLGLSGSGPAFGWADVLPFAYAAGALLFLSRLGAHLVRLLRVVRRNGVRRSGEVRIVAVDRDFSPFSFLGLVFIDARRLAEADLRRILAHEQVHVRQGHTFDVLLMELVIVLQWFNPFVWPYKKALRETHEYLADSGVIAQGFSSAKYRRLVYEQHVGTALFEFGNNFKQSQIKRRIVMMSRNPSSRAARLKLLLALPLVLALVLAFADPRAVAQTAASTPSLHVTPAQEKAADPDLKAKAQQALDEIKKLQYIDQEIGLKLEAAKDNETRQALESKRVEVRKRMEKLFAFLKESNMLPPKAIKPSSDTEGLKAEFKLLKEKEMVIRAEMEKSDDAAKKAEMKETLAKILAKQEQLKVLAAKESPGAMKYPEAVASADELNKMLAELKAKEADVRTQLESTQDTQKIEELKNLIQKIQQKRETIQFKLQELKTLKSEKIEK